MGRRPRDKTPDTVYHVIARGNNREALFLSDKDRITYLELWRKYSSELEFDVYAYVLMTNHVHWMIRAGRVPISSIIHTIHGMYARKFNKTNNRVGHVFQGRFRSEICSNDRYVLSLCRYIHLNPVEAGIVNKPLEYTWSSYLDLCGIRKDPLVQGGFLLDYFNRSGTNGLRRWVEEETTEETNQQQDIFEVSEKFP
ncbi:MAG: transposase [Bacillota bacterium]